MDNRIFFMLAAAIHLMTLSPAYAQNNGRETAGQKTAITYEAYLETIAASLPEIKSNTIDVLNADNAVRQAKSPGDVSLNGSVGYSYLDTNRAAQASSYRYDTDQADYSFGVSKKFLSTGTDVSLNFDYTPGAYEGYPATYRPSATLKVSQPLLYNFLGKVDRYAEKNAKMKAEIARLRQQENDKSVLNAYRKLYFEWLTDIRILELINESVRNARIERDQVGKNLRAGISEDDDYQRTVAAVLSYENQHVQFSTSLKNVENILSLYIDSVGTAPDERELSDYFDRASGSGFASVGFDATNSYKIIDLSLKNLDYANGVYENRLLPELNVFAGITKKDLGDYSSSAYARDPGYNVGVEISYRLGDSAARSDLESIKIQVKSLRYEYEKTQNDYTKNLLSLQEAARGAIGEIKTTRAILESLRLRLRTETKKYGQGRLGLSYVIDTKNSIASHTISLLNLQYRLISYYIDYMDATR